MRTLQLYNKTANSILKDLLGMLFPYNSEQCIYLENIHILHNSGWNQHAGWREAGEVCLSGMLSAPAGVCPRRC